MRFPVFYPKRRALPNGGLWCEIVMLLSMVFIALLYRKPPVTLLWPAFYAILPLLWVTGMMYLRLDLKRCRRGAAIYNWRMTISRILAIVNGFVVVWILAVIMHAFG